MTKSTHVFLCGGATPLNLETMPGATELRLHKNIRFEIARFLNHLLVNLPDRVMDLLDIAAYVYVADQMTSRGGDLLNHHGKLWRRSFDFYIPVRDLDFWGEARTQKALVDALSFLSEDNFIFQFSTLNDPPELQRYFEFEGASSVIFKPDTVMLFSGGLDSLAGAIDEGKMQGKKVAMVTHCATSKLRESQIELFNRLDQLFPNQFHQLPVTVNKIGLHAKEYTQRTRSFLFSSLAYSVAHCFGLDRIKFYENGIVSVNLPIAEQVTGSRASRTTHPAALRNFETLFTMIEGTGFKVESPFLLKTKTEVVQLIRANDLGNLIHQSSSCAHTWEKSRQKTHCGKCSQCIDRRFATLAAGCTDDEDPEIDYELDLLVGERDQKEEHSQMLYGYVQQVRQIHKFSLDQFVYQFPELGRILSIYPQPQRANVAQDLFELHYRHSSQVLGVISDSFSKYGPELAEGDLPSTCLLRVSASNSSSPITDEINQYDLILKPAESKANGNAAKLLGRNAFEGLSKPLGMSDMFCLYYIFQSKTQKKLSGRLYTVVDTADLLAPFVKWIKAGHFQLKAGASPKRRLDEYLHRFEERMNKTELRGLVAYGSFGVKGNAHKYVGICIPPNALQCELKEFI